MKDNTLALIRKVGDAMRKHVDGLVSGLDERLKALECKALDVYQLAVSKGFEGSAEEFLASLKGAPGKDGANAEPGRDGRDGRDGKDGKDALDVAVLPSIDEARSYPRGTWASHRGGLWVARRATEGLDGWECVVVGVASMETHFKTDREIECTVELSDGTTRTTGTILPVMLDRGVYKQGMSAQAGDCVSFGGSLWVAQRDTDAKPGTDDSGWRLAVKKGRDGRDGTDGKDGRDGLNGKDWKGDRVQ